MFYSFKFSLILQKMFMLAEKLLIHGVNILEFIPFGDLLGRMGLSAYAPR